MGHKTFIGGVHPYDGKELSKDSPIKEVLPKGDMVYPVSQHIGAPAKPVVAVGDTVLKGQMIAEAGGFVSSPIYSSVSGKVKAIEKRRVAVGDTKKCFDAFLLVVFEAQKRLYRGKLLKDIEYLHITEGVILLIFLVFIL